MLPAMVRMQPIRSLRPDNPAPPCRHAPYLVEFQERAHVFATLVAMEKRARAEDDWAAGRRFSGPAVATIRRDQLLTDGFAQLNLVRAAPAWRPDMLC